jgi:hypothetical protein
MTTRAKRPWQLHAVAEQGWIHTHGLDKLGLPELEMLDVPGFLMEAAAGLLHHVADYLCKPHSPVLVGQTMQTSEHTRFRFVRGSEDWLPELEPGQADHYAVERWRIVDVEVRCACCQLTPSDHN